MHKLSPSLSHKVGNTVASNIPKNHVGDMNLLHAAASNEAYGSAQFWSK